jgi:hypothetical protein
VRGLKRVQPRQESLATSTPELPSPLSSKSTRKNLTTGLDILYISLHASTNQTSSHLQLSSHRYATSICRASAPPQPPPRLAIGSKFLILFALQPPPSVKAGLTAERMKISSKSGRHASIFFLLRGCLVIRYGELMEAETSK